MNDTLPLVGYYVWYRLVAMNSQASAQGGAKSTAAVILGGGKPPKKKSYVPLPLLQAEAGHHGSACFHIGSGAHKEGTPEVFDNGPAFASEAAAIAWSQGAGQKWIDEAVNCVLVGFSFDVPAGAGAAVA